MAYWLGTLRRPKGQDPREYAYEKTALGGQRHWQATWLSSTNPRTCQLVRHATRERETNSKEGISARIIKEM